MKKKRIKESMVQINFGPFNELFGLPNYRNQLVRSIYILMYF